ncbi:MAG TPA: hypothetical protein VGT41_06835 [Candidatus Babeliales bacterium]|nr:hypothetical protein [Candidatus Babeliales bacterium]
MKMIKIVLVYGLTIISPLYPSAAPGDVETHAAIQASLEDPAAIRAQLERERRLEAFRKQEEVRIRAGKEKKQGTLHRQKEAAGPIATQEDTKEEEEKDAQEPETIKLYTPYSDPKLRTVLGNVPRAIGEHIESLATPSQFGDPNAPKALKHIKIAGLQEAVADISPDGTFIATGSTDGHVYLREPSEGKIFDKFRVSEREIVKILICNNTQLIVTQDSDDKIYIYDRKTRTLLPAFTSPSRIISIAVSKNNAFIVTGCTDHNAYVWSIRTGELLFTLTGHTAPVKFVAIDPKNMFIVTATSDLNEPIRIWNATNGNILYSNETGFPIGPQLEYKKWGAVTSLAISPNGNFIAATINATAYLWSATSGKLLYSLDHDNAITALAFSPNNKFLVTGGGQTINVWQISSGTLYKKIAPGKQLLTFSRIETIAVGNNKFIAIIGAAPLLLSIWDLETGKLLQKAKSSPEWSWPSIPLIISPDDQFIVTYSNKDNEIDIWKPKPSLPPIAQLAREQTFMPEIIKNMQELIAQAQAIQNFSPEIIKQMEYELQYLTRLDPAADESNHIYITQQTIKRLFNRGNNDIRNLALMTQATAIPNFPPYSILNMQSIIRTIKTYDPAAEESEKLYAKQEEDLTKLFNEGQAAAQLITPVIIYTQRLLEQANKMPDFPQKEKDRMLGATKGLKARIESDIGMVRGGKHLSTLVTNTKEHITKIASEAMLSPTLSHARQLLQHADQMPNFPQILREKIQEWVDRLTNIIDGTSALALQADFDFQTFIRDATAEIDTAFEQGKQEHIKQSMVGPAADLGGMGIQ